VAAAPRLLTFVKNHSVIKVKTRAIIQMPSSGSGSTSLIFLCGVALDRGRIVIADYPVTGTFQIVELPTANRPPENETDHEYEDH
jgi:hypothetical protein